ncbi:hypothetical protein I0E98_10365 [Pseudomonas lalucatii]|nr:hypothetical protein [Pseudomonas lalucatii]
MCLADLAHYHDGKFAGEEYKLVFVEEDSIRGSRALTLQPYLDISLLSYTIEAALLESLQECNFEKNPQVLKERSIFRASVVEFLDGTLESRERFRVLISTWEEFVKLYQNNLDTYLSGFSFHKAKQEVASAELTIAEQLSKIVSDISGKVLSIPISLVATIAVVKAGNTLESSLLVAGIAIASALMAETLAAQKLQYQRIKHSRTLIFRLTIRKASSIRRTYVTFSMQLSKD